MPRSQRSLFIAAASALLLGSALACETLGARFASHCPVALVPSDALPQDLTLEQRIRMTTGEGTTRVDTAAQVEDGALVLVGLTPMGTRGFALTQRGTRIEVEDPIGRRLGLRPRLLLDLLHRSEFVSHTDGTASDGEQRYERNGEIVRESWREGRWTRRSFAATRAPDALRVVIERGQTDRTLDIRNDWCGYEARVLTLSRRSAR